MHFFNKRLRHKCFPCFAKFSRIVFCKTLVSSCLWSTFEKFVFVVIFRCGFVSLQRTYIYLFFVIWKVIEHYESETLASYLVRCCFSIPPENIRKPKGFLMFSVERFSDAFRGYRKATPGCNVLNSNDYTFNSNSSSGFLKLQKG